MKILYDGFIYRVQRAGGVNRYLANIINRLPADWTPLLAVHQTREFIFPNHPRLVLKRSPAPYLRPGRLADWAARRFFARVESKRGLDLIHSVFHFTLKDNHAATRKAPFILTIHDLIPEIFRRDIDPDGVEVAVKQKAVQEADAVICVSKNTRKDLLERIHIPEKKVFVTPLASELSQDMATGDEPVPERPYFMFVGARPIYKNFVRLALAFAQVAEKWPEVELCVVGAPFNATERGLLDALKIRGRVQNVGHVPDRHLAKLYHSAVALVYPSMYEGFGIPPLEAMGCGTVVIAAGVSSIPEVVGDAAILIDPESIDSMVHAMLQVRDLGIEDRRNFIARGIARAQCFDWEETARRTREIYQAVVN